MIRINKLREFLAEAKLSIEEVNYTQLVVDDSELEGFMKDRPESDNILLFGVVPDHQIIGSQDATKTKNQLLFFIVKKSSAKNLTHEQYLNMFDETQQVAMKFIQKLLEEKSKGCLFECCFLQELDESSIVVEPIWKKAGCNGYLISFDLLSSI